MPKVKRTLINLDSGDEVGVSLDHLGRLNSNPQRLIEEIGPSRIRDLPRRMSIEISSSSRKDGPYGGIGERERAINKDLVLEWYR